MNLYLDGDQCYTAAKVREMFSSLVQLHLICHSKSPLAHDAEESSLDVTASSLNNLVNGEVDAASIHTLGIIVSLTNNSSIAILILKRKLCET